MLDSEEDSIEEADEENQSDSDADTPKLPLIPTSYQKGLPNVSVRQNRFNLNNRNFENLQTKYHQAIKELEVDILKDNYQ